MANEVCFRCGTYKYGGMDHRVWVHENMSQLPMCKPCHDGWAKLDKSQAQRLFEYCGKSVDEVKEYYGKEQNMQSIPEGSTSVAAQADERG